MTRYLPGIILVQVVALALLWVNLGSAPIDLLMNVALPVVLLSTVTALWFSAISKMDTQRAHAQLVAKHFEEREKLTRELERARADFMQKASSDQARIIERASQERERIVRQTQEDMRKAERRASRNADMKVGAAFMLAIVFGVGMLFFQLMSFGLFIIGTSVGTLSGYLLRWRQTRHIMKLAGDSAIVESTKPAHLANEPIDDRKAPIVINADTTANTDAVKLTS